MSEPSASTSKLDTALDPTRRAHLLDDEGALSEKLESVLRAIFCKYATHPSVSGTNTAAAQAGHNDGDLAGWCIEPEGLARFGTDTNGAPMPQDQIDEMKTYLDCDEHGNLVFRGFLQLYQLQTENDEDETWKDLAAHGYNENLELHAP